VHQGSSPVTFGYLTGGYLTDGDNKQPKKAGDLGANPCAFAFFTPPAYSQQFCCLHGFLITAPCCRCHFFCYVCYVTGGNDKKQPKQPKKAGDPGANPRAFAFQSAVKAKAYQARSAEKEQRRLHGKTDVLCNLSNL
jgi:hypothetical protein